MWGSGGVSSRDFESPGVGIPARGCAVQSEKEPERWGEEGARGPQSLARQRGSCIPGTSKNECFLTKHRHHSSRPSCELQDLGPGPGDPCAVPQFPLWSSGRAAFMASHKC